MFTCTFFGWILKRLGMNCLSFSESSYLSLAYSHFMLYILLKLTTQNQIDISMVPKQFPEIAERSLNMANPSVRLQIQDQYVSHSSNLFFSFLFFNLIFVLFGTSVSAITSVSTIIP